MASETLPTLVVLEPHLNLLIDGTVVHSRVAPAGAGTVLATDPFSGTNEDDCRNVQVVDAGAAAGDVVIRGYNYKGELITETIPIAGGGTFIGNVAFAWITEIDFPATGGGNIDVCLGSRIGLGNPIGRIDTFIAKKNFLMMNSVLFTVSLVYNTIEETGVAVAALDTFTFAYQVPR